MVNSSLSTHQELGTTTKAEAPPEIQFDRYNLPDEIASIDSISIEAIQGLTAGCILAMATILAIALNG